ncbi:AraC family transcriptional regulator [Microlunatus sp. Gsoil 973]|uniref:helix-turn-helix domain-containing protein n=1 Tax=Microlunatus sp. Gsoil 973 TaxID=2672569 RepID=UPI001E4F2C42|nr:helix-turn-helix domain-containing protein [Microlunatus sp. Gsoil 973]
MADHRADQSAYRSGSSDRLLWDIACPGRPSRIPGVTMAGFGDRGRTPPELRLIPHPAVTLVLVVDGTVAALDAGGRLLTGSFVAGVGFGDSLRIVRADAFACVQVRLSPTVARAALGPVITELDATVVTLDELLGGDAGRLTGRLSGLGSWEERFAVADAFVAERCATVERSNPEVDWAWQQIVAARGTGQIEALAAELGWSRKRLWSQFRSRIGLTPKRAARLVRFDQAVHRLVAGQQAVEVAAEIGYADQSHLHREIADFTGLTPGTVVKEPFLAVDDVAWGWPGRDTGRLQRS